MKVMSMNKIIPEKLKAGDKVRIIAPSMSMAILSKETQDIANQRFNELGLKLTFSKHIFDCDDFHSSSVQTRLDDLHEAFQDKAVKGIFTVIGGFNSNQLLDDIDYELIKNNPKILCGYSDITALEHAIYAKTGLVTYSGPHYSTFGMKQGFDWSLDYVKKCLFSNDSYEINTSSVWSDDAWYLDQDNRNYMSNEGFWVLNEGQAKGTILGANLCTLNLLQGTRYWPSLHNTILFLEDDSLPGEFSAVEFDRNLQSIIHQPGFDQVKGLLIGRFQKKSDVKHECLLQIIKSKKLLNDIPVIANVDFGHTDPMITFPIGGTIHIKAEQADVKIVVIEH